MNRDNNEIHKERDDLNDLSSKVIGLAIKIHRRLGPGLLESAYQECLIYELNKSGFRYQKEKPMPIIYEEIKLDHGYRIDILVENQLVLEIKSIEAITNVHLSQITTYLRLGEFKLGLLINFNVKILKDGIRRVINNW